MSAKSYVWGVLSSQADPPRGIQLHNSNGHYTFYPFRHEGHVLTIDVSLWHATSGKEHSQFKCWPNAVQVLESVGAQARESWALIAVTRSAKAMTIDPNVQMDLQVLSDPPKGFVEAGYDVIDMNGLSGLANVGCTKLDVEAIESLSLVVNRDGLLPDLTQATKYATTISTVAPEHSPFFPTLILAREPAE